MAAPRAHATTSKKRIRYPKLRAALKRMRVDHGYTQQELADEINARDPAKGSIDNTTISKWETGKQNISPYAVPILEAILDCPGVLATLIHADRYPDSSSGRTYRATVHMFYPAMLACDLRCPEDADVPGHRFRYVSAKRMRDFDGNRTVYFFEFRAVVLHERIELENHTLADIFATRRQAREAARQMLSTSLCEYCNVAPDLVKTVPFALSMIELRADRPADELSRTLQLLAAPSLIGLLLNDPAWGPERESAILADTNATTGMHPFTIAALQTGWATHEGVAFHQTGTARDFSDTAADLMIQLQALRRYASHAAETKTVTSTAYGPDFFDEAADRIENPELGEDRFRERQLLRALSDAYQVRRIAREAIDELSEPHP